MTAIGFERYDGEPVYLAMASECRFVPRGSIQDLFFPNAGRGWLFAIGALALIVPASLTSSEPIVDPESILWVSLENDAQIHLSPKLQPSLERDDWTRLKSRMAIAVASAYLQSITGPAQIRQDGAWTWLEVSDGNNHFKTSWVHPTVQLVPGRTYTFVVFSHPHWEASVEKIFDEGRIIYDLSVCQVHDFRMGKEAVPVIYGYNSHRKSYPSTDGAEPSFETRMQLFPHYVEVASGGCVNNGERTVMLYACPKCRAAFTQWAQHMGYFRNLSAFDNGPALPVGFHR